jgi:hypothetical protein
MSAINRGDVKNHLHSPLETRIHLVQPESQPDATGFSGAEPDTMKADPSGSTRGPVAEDSSSGITVAPTDSVTGSIGQQALSKSKCAQA